MIYTILDLEWDSAYSVKHKRFINQILQIGAVKLDDGFNVIDTFEVTVKSAISARVTGRFAELTGITTEKMRAGIPFDAAVDSYNSWAADDCITMTWSDSDLYAIKANEEYLLGGERKFKMGKYLDLQKFIQGEMRLSGFDEKNQISLSGAAERLGISTEGYDLHTACDDSLVCAALLKKCYNAERFSALVRDTADPEFYRRLSFKPYTITDLKSPFVEKSFLEFRCRDCGADCKRLSGWKYRNRWFSAKFECSACKKHFIGRIFMTKTYDSVKVRRRVCEIKPKTENNKNDMQPVSETV